ncbi:universal stress protein [Alkalibacter rhizosphaerae]|uniref:Universal stress protein n=1 Tax=Alkalibacter rhizosphaerae TaxID=2815577 RepID=A0A975AGM6_9FIRM|nr:universal stress protein [Alkalibacter rhizosphaerae]QSX07537.1 universal stress protein [Alkalibacter rhizosphaerae]
MFKRVIVATDLSPTSDGLVRCLDQLKPFNTKECLLLQCLSVQETASIAIGTTATVLEKALQRQKTWLEEYGFSVDTRVVSGQIKSEINQIAQKEKYGLIVTGSKKQSAASEVFFKGLPYDLALHSKVPVLLVRLEETAAGITCQKPFSDPEETSLLFPTDFSKNANVAFERLMDMVSDGITRITLMHVQNKSRMKPEMVARLEEFNKQDQEKLDLLRQQLLDKGAKDVEILIKFGEPSEEILLVAESIQPQLIVMGSQGRGFVREMLLGSVSRRITRSANTSVLLVPARG